MAVVRDNHSSPLALVISAPSGAGKSTLCKRLLEEFTNLKYSVSCTTREPRSNEKEGEHYCFLSEKEFRERIVHGEFLEYARVHGNFYGTLEKTVSHAMRIGLHVLLDIDVQGARQIRSSMLHMEPTHPIRRGFTDIFITPPSVEALEKRLRSRRTETEKAILKRLENARFEMEAAAEYAFRIVNDNLEQAYRELRTVFLSRLV